MDDPGLRVSTRWRHPEVTKSRVGCFYFAPEGGLVEESLPKYPFEIGPTVVSGEATPVPGQPLKSRAVAVFVDGDDRIDPLLAATQPLLRERNIPIMGYKGGLVVGDAREVRIFDVQHIKGMEFEAVFFVGIDRLAERIPGLFLRFLSKQSCPSGLSP